MTIPRWILLAVLTALALSVEAVTTAAETPTTTQTQAVPPPASGAKLSAAQLEKLAMPIALHPDPLISIILPAAVYPLEIVQAARFVKDTNNIAKLAEQSWDENVKSVAKFPDLIAKMDQDIDWTVNLGKAFVDQPKELMDTIQALRAKAQKAGTLKTTPQQVVTVTNVVVVQTNITQVVTVTNQVVQVQPANPQVIYVPSYPPTVYYPPSVYYPYAPLVTFGVGMAVGAIIANNCDWHGGCVWVGGGGVWVGGGGYHGDIDIDIDNVNIDRNDRPNSGSGNRANTGAKPTQQKWQPDQNRMRTAGTAPSTRDARGWGGASAQPSTRPSQVAAPGTGTARPSQQPGYSGTQRPAAATQPARTSAAAQPSATARTAPMSQPAARPAASSSFSGASSQPSTAFGGVNSGSGARSAATRGASSRGGGGGGGMRGGGGRGR